MATMRKTKKKIATNGPAEGTNPRMALLELMKSAAGKDPETLASFRGDVDYIANQWDGERPILWFVYEGATHRIVLGAENAARSVVWNDRRLVASAAEMAAPSGRVHVIQRGVLEEESYNFLTYQLREIGGWLRDYYEEKEPLASLGC